MNRNSCRVDRLCSVGAFGAALLCIAIGCGDAETAGQPVASPMPMMDGPTPFIRPGKRQPAVEPADLADVGPDDEIIGVAVGDVHRAYVCAAMSAYDTKVINDVLDGTALTIAFCDRTRCSRAFTVQGRREPLNVELGGWSGDQMLLRIDGQMIRLDSDKIPFEEVSLERSTWGKWKDAHPKTDVFTGRTGSESKVERPE